MSYQKNNEERRELEAAGWEPKEREDETVWKNPKSGYWYPQDVAISLLREGVDAGDIPLGPEGGTQAPRETPPEKGSDRRPYEEPKAP